MLAPLAGGPCTPALAAAVSNAGGLGFLAAGYLAPDQLEERLTELAASTDRPFGVNLFCSQPTSNDEAAIRAYRDALRPLAAAAGVKPRRGLASTTTTTTPSWRSSPAVPPDVASFTFGCPSETAIDRLRRAGVRVWVTVTDVEEAKIAAARGADALVAQGAQAGGHRGSFLDDDDEPTPLARPARRDPECAAHRADRCHRRPHDRWRHRRRARRWRRGRAARNGVPALPRGGHERRPPARPAAKRRTPC